MSDVGGPQAGDGRKAQFRMTYSELEDRVLFTGVFVDGTQVNVWLTRRLAFGFLDLAQRFSDATAAGAATDGAAAPPAVKQEITAFEKQAAVQQADLSSPFVSGQPHKDLGNMPLLVTRLSLVPLTEGAVSVRFGLPDRRELSFPVARDTFLTLWNMLEGLIRDRTGWRTVSPRTEPEPAARAVLH